MVIVDESVRVVEMAQQVISADGEFQRDDLLALLEAFCYSAASELRRTLIETEDPGRATVAAVRAYQRDREAAIAYRRGCGLPVSETF